MCFGTWRVLTDLLATGSLFQSLADITQPPEKSAIIWDVPLVADTLLHWSDVNLFPDQSLLLFRYLECDENHYHGWITQRYRLAHCKSAILMYHNGPSELVKVGSLVWDTSKYRKRTRCRHPIRHIFFFSQPHLENCHTNLFSTTHSLLILTSTYLFIFSISGVSSRLPCVK